jgi:asparagine synthase (glutamine-hydrolysing)
MCGIAGLTWHDPELAVRMADSLRHRGPDQSGVFASESVTLSHRRLSIIDLHERGRQPMTNARRSVWVTYNGEIYNFAELRAELERFGHEFRTRTDTEVIVHAWSEWGTGCVERFNGMFAFAVWDVERQELFLARDRIGIKPLYWTMLPGERHDLVFASEIKAILQCPAVSREVDPQSVYRYMGYEFVPSPGTIFRHVHKLPPGHWLLWRVGREPRVERYWRLEARSVRRTPAEHALQLRERLETAVKRQLVSDVPLGVFLSGGLDSSAIVAMMHRLGVDPLDTFSLHYEDASFSELEYADYVAKQFGTRHHVMRIDPVHPDMIETCCHHLDEPMTDLSAMPFYMLCAKVREHVTVCLSGEGGDELLCGYDRFKASRLNSYYRLLPAALRNAIIAPLVGRLGDRPQKKGAVNMLKRFIEGASLPEDGRHMRWQYFLPPESATSLFNADARSRIDFDPFAPVRAQLTGAIAEDRFAEEILVDMSMTLPDSLLMKADKMSMAHALEVRVPLLDHEFAEFCCTIPGNLKLDGLTTKAIFRTAMDGILPDHIRGRGKQGYSLPIKNWLRGELRDYMEDILAGSPLIDEYFDRRFIRRLIDEHMGLKANHNHVLWALLNLAVWHGLFIAPASTSSDAASAGVAGSS